MKKRKKLSLTQKRRIQINRQRKLDSATMTTLDDGAFAESEAAVVISRFGQHAEIKTADNCFVKAQIRRNIDSLVTGDQVIIRRSRTSEDAIIEGVQPRLSQLTRPDPYDGVKIVAANIDQICIVSSHQPTFSTQLIDRYLIASEDTDITPIIILTKVDLLDDEQQRHIQEILLIYQGLGYQVFMVSAVSAFGLTELKAILSNKNNILVGQSGVGKSSLVNALEPESQLEEGHLSKHSNLGRHTTTTSKLLFLSQGGCIVDSPGIREFGLWHLDPQRVTSCYPEFRPYLGHCKFKDCKHHHDPGCAIKEAVTSGHITQLRYDNYVKIIASMAELKTMRHLKPLSPDK